MLFAMPQGFLPGGLTHTCSRHLGAKGDTAQWSFISSLLSMYMLVLSCHIKIVSMLSQIQITSSHALFTNFRQHMHT
jgi:hypothetical protein